MRIYKSVDQFQAEGEKKWQKKMCKIKRGKASASTYAVHILKRNASSTTAIFFQSTGNRNIRSLTEAITFLTWFKIIFSSFTFFLF